MSKTTTGKLQRAIESTVPDATIASAPVVPLHDRYAAAAGEYAQRVTELAMIEGQLRRRAGASEAEDDARIAGEYEATQRALSRAWDGLAALFRAIRDVAGAPGDDALADLLQFAPARMIRSAMTLRPFLGGKLAAIGKMLATSVCDWR
jgi:hypothetical protein